MTYNSHQRTLAIDTGHQKAGIHSYGEEKGKVFVVKSSDRSIIYLDPKGIPRTAGSYINEVLGKHKIHPIRDQFKGLVSLLETLRNG